MLQALNREIAGSQAFPTVALRASRSGSTRSCCASPASSRPSPRRSGARANTAPTTTTISRASFAPVLRDIQDFLSARLDRRAIRLELIERAPNAYHLDDQGPHAVPQRDLRARGVGASPADRNPAEPAGLSQDRPQHQDERDRARASARRAAGPSADAAAADSRDHRPRLFLSRPHFAAVAGIQRGHARSACISQATGRSSRWSSGPIREGRR